MSDTMERYGNPAIASYVIDAGGYYVADNVETALAEVYEALTTNVPAWDLYVNTLRSAGNLRVDGDNILDSSGAVVISFNGAGDIDQIGSVAPVAGDVLVWSAANTRWQPLAVAGIGLTWAQTLVAGNQADGTDVIVDEGADLIVYSDNVITEVVRIDGATGNITTIGTVDGVDISAISLSNMPVAATGNINCGGQAITNVGNVDGVDVSAIVAFTTITGITNDVVADGLTDTLTLASGNTILTIVGTAATDTITFTIVEAQINHDNIGGVSADDHHNQSHALTTHSDVSLADPNADQIVFWDDSDSQFEFLVANTGLSIVGNNLNCDITQYTDVMAVAAVVAENPLALTNALNIGSIVAGVADYDKFLVSDGGLVKFRTGAEVLADIGASASAHLHNTQTLLCDGINSDGGAFPFDTTGDVSFNQAIKNPVDNKGFYTGIGDDFRWFHDGTHNYIYASTGSIFLGVNALGNLSGTAKVGCVGPVLITRPDGKAHTWIPYTDGELYFTADLDGGASLIATFRTFAAPATYTSKVEIDTSGNIQMDGDLTAVGANLTSELDMTGALACIDLNPAGTGTKNIIDITPTAALVAGSTWDAIYVDMQPLDPATGAACSIIGMKVQASTCRSVDNDANIYGYMFYAPDRDNSWGFYHSMNELDIVNTQVGFITYGAGAYSVSATYRGLYVHWSAITRDANAPVLEGVRVDLPADYSNFGTTWAAQFTGDGRSVTICDTSYALTITGDSLVSDLYSTVSQWAFCQNRGDVNAFIRFFINSDTQALTEEFRIHDDGITVYGNGVIGGDLTVQGGDVVIHASGRVRRETTGDGLRLQSTNVWNDGAYLKLTDGVTAFEFYYDGAEIGRLDSTGNLQIDGGLTTGGHVTRTAGQFNIISGNSAVAIRSAANMSQYFDCGGSFLWRDMDAAYAIRMTLLSATGHLSIIDELDMTGTGSCIDLNPAGTGSKNIIDITPTAALSGAVTWQGLYMGLSALDPDAAANIYGIVMDLRGIDMTNDPNMRGLWIRMPNAYAAGTEYGIIVAGDGRTVTICEDADAINVDGHGGTSGLIDINPSGTTSQYVIDITPNAALDAGQTWRGINMELSALDPATGAVCTVHGVRVSATGLDSIDANTTVYGFLFYPSVVESCSGFYVGLGEITQAGEIHQCFYSYLAAVLSTTATYRGLYLNWGGTTRDANAPVLQGIRADLPASYANYGTSYAARLTGDGRTVIICDTSYALNVSGAMNLVGAITGVTTLVTTGNVTVGGDIQINGHDIKNSGGVTVISLSVIPSIDALSGFTCDLDPLVNPKFYDMGTALLSWDDCYADDWHFTSAWKTFADPLAILKGFRPEAGDPYEIDHSGIDDWIKARIKAKAKNEKGFLKWEGGYVLKPKRAKTKARKVYVERLGKKVPVGNYADGYSDEDFEHEEAISINKTQIVLIQAIKKLEQRVKELEAGS